MKKEVSNYTFIQLIKYLKENNYSTYANEIENSLFIDQSLVNLGFAKEPPYVIEVNINKPDLTKIINNLELLHNSNFSVFDEYLEVYDLLTEILNEEKL